MSLTVPAADVSGLPIGGSRCMTLPTADGKKFDVIIARSADGTLRAAMNRCKHMDAPFVPDVEDAGKLKCTMHGWLLDPTTMTYVETSQPKALGFTIATYPPGTRQPELVVAAAADGSATLTLPESAKSSSGCLVV